MIVTGVDLAWQSETNTSSVAVASVTKAQIHVSEIASDLLGVDQVCSYILNVADVSGIAIDAPLIIENLAGQRPCERYLSKEYGSRYASCHASNLTLYPNPSSVLLSQLLEARGYKHLRRDSARWQIEVYPHPAIIEFFNLSERHKYKKGRVDERRGGQAALARYVLDAGVVLSDHLTHHFDSDHIATLRGRALKQNEDAIDSVVCAMIAASYAIGGDGMTFGDLETGYIYVPRPSVAD